MVTLLSNARIATMGQSDMPYGLMELGAMVIDVAGTITWVGDNKSIPTEYLDQVQRQFDCNGALLTPGLIDCHTHLVYGGDRSHEFEQRLLGVSYSDIANAGGGIQSTVEATRVTSETDLLTDALKRVDNLCLGGVTTLEIKSGYGLDLETELKMLRVARRVSQERKLRVKTTYLAAHALPIEYKRDADDYIRLVCEQMLPTISKSGLADAVDGFCESIAFNTDQIERLFATASKYKLPVKLHAEQLSAQGGAQLAARYNALSADHLEYLDSAGIDAMAKHNTVAVLLPGAFYYLNETQKPPVAKLRAAEIPIALASDCNPGSSPIASLPLILNMGCLLFGLTPEEALSGVTRNAAQALGIGELTGTLEIGKQADIALWDAVHPSTLSYQVGLNNCIGRFLAGEPIDINRGYIHES